MRFKVDFYKEIDGSKPLGSFIKSLELKMKAKVIATNGFIKKKQKTQKSEIELAKKRRADYFRRKETNTYE